MLVIQATTIGGVMVEGARWEVENITNMREGHVVQVSLRCSDKELLSYLSKQTGDSCVVDKDNNSFHVILRHLVKEIRHMVAGTSKAMDTMVIVIPVNRMVESALLYCLHPERCDKRFIQAVRAVAAPAPP